MQLVRCSGVVPRWLATTRVLATHRLTSALNKNRPTHSPGRWHARLPCASIAPDYPPPGVPSVLPNAAPSMLTLVYPVLNSASTPAVETRGLEPLTYALQRHRSPG